MIVDARVSAISTGTNLRYETMTNSSGEYYLANLPPNLYRIEVEKNGFTKLIKPDVVLRGEFFNILNHPILVIPSTI